MGNYVMKCCVGVAVVRVMRPNGRIDEFDFPVTASEVMQRYPQHLVIHSTYNSSFENHRRKVSIVRPESKLLPGHEYILYPIPDQYRETVAQSFAKFNTGDEGNVSNGEDEEPSSHSRQHQLNRRVSRRSQLLGATRHHLSSVLKSTRDSRIGDLWCAEKSIEYSGSPRTGGLESGKRSKVVEDIDRENEGEGEGEGETNDEEFSFCYGASWKPSLYSIPESPLVLPGTHTRRHSSSSLSSLSTSGSPSYRDRLET